MSIASTIENLKQKSPETRKKIAFWSSFSIVLIIFVFWLTSFMSLGVNLRGQVSSVAGRAYGPVDSLVASVGGLFDDISDIIFKPKKIIYTNIEATTKSK